MKRFMAVKVLNFDAPRDGTQVGLVEMFSLGDAYSG